MLHRMAGGEGMGESATAQGADKLPFHVAGAVFSLKGYLARRRIKHYEQEIERIEAALRPRIPRDGPVQRQVPALFPPPHKGKEIRIEVEPEGARGPTPEPQSHVVQFGPTFTLTFQSAFGPIW